MYAAANQCIYCRATTTDLSREHIIPYALGGTLVIPRASCSTHSRVTSDFERIVARDMYGVDRALGNLPSRKRGTHEKKLSEAVEVVGLDANGVETPFTLKRTDMPRMLGWIEMPAPGILRGGSAEVNDSVTMRTNYQRNPQANKRLSQLGLSTLRVTSSSIDESAFTRLLAKIGHAFAAASLGLDGFEPWLLPLILGEPASRTYLVGGFDPQQQQSKNILSLRKETHSDFQLAVIDISLQAFPHLPKYQVVAGRVREA